jgi:glycosyltransferase involved in cell wall biosynthesis
LETSFASVELPPEAFVVTPRPRRSATPTVVSVGSLEQPYKGVDTLLHALAALAADGLAVRLVHVGDGRFREQLEQLADDLGIRGSVTFTGTLLPGEAVRRQLDAADLFVLPSRTEGLPRALIEAMARGLPAIGSNVGGIPELLPAQFLVPPDDAPALARRIGDVLADPTLLAAAARRNLDRAQAYRDTALAGIRRGWYEAVRSATEMALATGAARPHQHAGAY